MNYGGLWETLDCGGHGKALPECRDKIITAQAQYVGAVCREAHGREGLPLLLRRKREKEVRREGVIDNEGRESESKSKKRREARRQRRNAKARH